MHFVNGGKDSIVVAQSFPSYEHLAIMGLDFYLDYEYHGIKLLFRI
jgi:hypothetical protein